MERVTTSKTLAALTRADTPGVKLGLLKDSSGQTVPENQTAQFLLDAHCPGNEEFKPLPPSTTKRKVSDFDFLNKKTVKMAIDDFGPRKAPGPDGIQPAVLQHLPENCIVFMVFLMRCSLSLSHVPKVWTRTNVTFLAKGGRRDWCDARSYRPISLSSFIHKAMERVLKWHLEDTYFKSRPFHNRQHAFRIGRSCDSALAETIDFIESKLYNRKFVLGLFLDIKGAFDSVAIVT